MRAFGVSVIAFGMGVIGATGCGGKTPAPAAGPTASTTPRSDWTLPPVEADLASRRVHGSKVAHVDDSVATPKSRLVKVAGPFRGHAAERELAPAGSTFPVEKGRCYRVYTEAEASIHAMAVVVEDAAGGLVVDDATEVAPQRGAFCADESATLTLQFSVGLGQGSYALEVWGN